VLCAFWCVVLCVWDKTKLVNLAPGWLTRGRKTRLGPFVGQAGTGLVNPGEKDPMRSGSTGSKFILKSSELAF